MMAFEMWYKKAKMNFEMWYKKVKSLFDIKKAAGVKKRDVL